MGIGRFAGASTVAQRQSECGRRNRQNARQPPLPIGVCYAFGVYLMLILLVDFSELFARNYLMKQSFRFLLSRLIVTVTRLGFLQSGFLVVTKENC